MTSGNLAGRTTRVSRTDLLYAVASFLVANQSTAVSLRDIAEACGTKSTRHVISRLERIGCLEVQVDERNPRFNRQLRLNEQGKASLFFLYPELADADWTRPAHGLRTSDVYLATAKAFVASGGRPQTTSSIAALTRRSLSDVHVELWGWVDAGLLQWSMESRAGKSCYRITTTAEGMQEMAVRLTTVERYARQTLLIAGLPPLAVETGELTR